MSMEVKWIGRIGYSEALEIQNAAVEEIARGNSGNIVFLLEHDPVYTIGRTPDKSSLNSVGNLPYPIIETNRGGQATFHGPGQLVGYPIIDLRPLRQDLHHYLRTLEEAVIEICRKFDVPAMRCDGLTGAWVGSRKIASIGVGVRKWITMHGFALNVCDDLSGFGQITPCGISGVEMTSLERESENRITLEDVAGVAADVLAKLPERLAKVDAGDLADAGE